ncbi:MAG: ribonucleoside-diphosphate reductase, adenosylcobalamin-dependent [Elusimicrobia bacterium RIFOXYA2_FULL_39_19]|nr:MAG: ribonucleoside-diphosphate reductase, adenosylcobalamin-dependent [Elusimicrobia bacterium RIFOXYA2_FULL_39_19]
MAVATNDLKEQVTSRLKPQINEHSLKILQKRYLRKDDSGNPIERPEDLFFRVAENIAKADHIYEPDKNIGPVIEEFYTIMANMEFIPNSPTLMNAGRELQQLSACFVLPIEDSMDSIFETLKNTALIHKSGGGTGFSFTRLRPKNDLVRSTTGVSSGPISFMQVFNAATEAIKQGGTRRGANMGILRVDHPDIMEFISCKDSNESLTNFNISVGLTEEFMHAVETDTDYNLYNPRDGEVVGSLKANEVFTKIIDQAWKNGEPGIIYLDRINENNPTPQIGAIESTNPCGEQPLLPYESCNLGSINLSRMLVEDAETHKKEVDWQKLEKSIKTAVHFLDNVIDMNNFPIDKIREMTRGNRKIGLGVMGWADMLIELEISYSSTEALRLAEKVFGFLQETAKETSRELAKQRGPFPNFSKSIFANGEPIRNATLTTIAPTGTIGLIAGCSSGVEPLFALVYTRSNILGGEKFIEVNSVFKKLSEKEGFFNEDLLKDMSEKGTIQSMKHIPSKIRRIFMTALDISPDMHIRMQGAFQKYVDNAVSKTVNFPHTATKEDVAKAYIMAYQLGCKGITVYRDKSRDKQVLNIGQSSSEGQSKSGVPITHGRPELKPRLRPRATLGKTLMMKTGCGKMYVTINEDNIGVCEIFTQLGKSGGCTSSQAEAIGRLISLSLRSGIKADELISQLKGIRCPTPMLAEGTAILSCADAVAKALENYLKEKATPDLFEAAPAAVAGGHAVTLTVEEPVTKPAMPAGMKTKGNLEHIGACPQCPECGNMLVIGEGCVYCGDCGFSRCW